MSLYFEGFDNNGVIIGPRSTRQSNPEEHASQYFNTFSKDMLVQVRFLINLIKKIGHQKKNGSYV